MENLFGYTFEKLEAKMVEMGQKKFRAQQLYSWLYQKRVKSFDEMSDISISFREELKKHFTIDVPSIITKQVSYDRTVKLLVECENKAAVETVLMRYDYGNAICVSSQVGCNMGCSFCASGLLRKQRDLSAAEIVGQIMAMQYYLDENEPGERVTHIVVMGTGEPFDNYDNVMSFVRICNHVRGLQIGARHITISTCGLVDKIRQYGKEGIQTNLAVSLHASNDEIRNQIMKISKVYSLPELMSAIKDYQRDSNRRVTFEYIMLKGVNDGIENAVELRHLLEGIDGLINLIPYNEVSENGYKRSSNDSVRAFYDKLKKLGCNVTIRKEFGNDIDAACGQLRAKKEGIL